MQSGTTLQCHAPGAGPGAALLQAQWQAVLTTVCQMEVDMAEQIPCRASKTRSFIPSAAFCMQPSETLLAMQGFRAARDITSIASAPSPFVSHAICLSPAARLLRPPLSWPSTCTRIPPRRSPSQTPSPLSPQSFPWPPPLSACLPTRALSAAAHAPGSFDTPRTQHAVWVVDGAASAAGGHGGATMNAASPRLPHGRERPRTHDVRPPAHAGAQHASLLHERNVDLHHVYPRRRGVLFP